MIDPTTRRVTPIHPGARSGNIPAVVARFHRRRLHARLDPWRAALTLRDDPRPFALTGAWAGGGAILGSAPVRAPGAGTDPFAALDDLPELPGGAPDGAVGGGWFGVLRYGLAAALEPVAPGPPRPVPLSLADLAYYDHVLRLDSEGGWWFEALLTPEREAAIRAREAELAARLAGAPPAPRPAATAGWRPIPGAAGHAEAVRAARARIAAGDVFQVNVCRRLEAGLDGALLDLWAAAAARLGPRRAAWFGGADGEVGSLSPELFLSVRDRRAVSSPIKGTRRRPGDAAAAERARGELEASDKDRAEHVMIVDLVRNDLGRCATPGTVRVSALARPEAHPGLWHLVSDVEARLAPGATPADAARAAFPPGSVTGAPKLAALDAIAEVESTARETYTGALGFASPAAGLELSVAIRTFEAAAGRVWLGVGGGVVADSDPAAEARETQDKAAALLAAIGVDPPAEPARDPRAPSVVRRGPRPRRRPDPAAGVFETVLVRDGRAVAPELHLARLARSARTLWGGALPAGLAGDVSVAAAGVVGEGRLRIDARPGAPPAATATEIVTGPLPAGARDAGPLAARAVALPGGLGAHKWRDRALLDALASDVGAGELVVLVDLDGFVLEASRAAVLVREGATLVAPPLDGRVLPSVTRERARALAPALGLAWREEPLPVRRLLAADEILVLGALRLAEVVAAWDGAPLPPAGDPVATRLRHALCT